MRVSANVFDNKSIVFLVLACLMLLTTARKETSIERAESLTMKAQGLIEIGYGVHMDSNDGTAPSDSFAEVGCLMRLTSRALSLKTSCFD